MWFWHMYSAVNFTITMHGPTTFIKDENKMVIWLLLVIQSIFVFNVDYFLIHWNNSNSSLTKLFGHCHCLCQKNFDAQEEATNFQLHWKIIWINGGCKYNVIWKCENLFNCLWLFVNHFFSFQYHVLQIFNFFMALLALSIFMKVLGGFPML